MARLLGTDNGRGRPVRVLSPPPTVPAKPFIPTVTSQATTTSSVPDSPLFTPRSIAFWTPTQGILVGTNTTRACGGSGNCTDGVVEKTTDGGASWKVVAHLQGELVEVAVTGSGDAWILASVCGGSPTTCPPTPLYRTDDGGSTWHTTALTVPLRAVAPTSFLSAWAVQGDPRAAFPVVSSLVHTDDGGQSWHTTTDPCPSAGPFNASSLDFANPRIGWLVCDGEPGAGQQQKALFATANGGATWQLQTSCAVSGGSKSLGWLSCSGYGPEISFLADGHGWLSLYRGEVWKTSDGGRTASTVAGGADEGDGTTVISLAVITDVDGAMIQRPLETQDFELFRTSDGGATWHLLHSWPRS